MRLNVLPLKVVDSLPLPDLDSPLQELQHP